MTALPNLEGYYQGIVMWLLYHLKVSFSKGHCWTWVHLSPMSFLPDLVHVLQVFYLLGFPSYFILVDLLENYINYPRSSYLRLLC